MLIHLKRTIYILKTYTANNFLFTRGRRLVHGQLVISEDWTKCNEWILLNENRLIHYIPLNLTNKSLYFLNLLFIQGGTVFVSTEIPFAPVLFWVILCFISNRSKLLLYLLTRLSDLHSITAFCCRVLNLQAKINFGDHLNLGVGWVFLVLLLA